VNSRLENFRSYLHSLKRHGSNLDRDMRQSLVIKAVRSIPGNARLGIKSIPQSWQPNQADPIPNHSSIS
jgi:hypothetical protein